MSGYWIGQSIRKYILKKPTYQEVRRQKERELDRERGERESERRPSANEKRTG